MSSYYLQPEEETVMEKAQSVVPYTYKAKYVRALSGDRFIAKIDVGFGWSIEQIVRIKGVVAPAPTSEIPELARKGVSARDYVHRVLSESVLFVITEKPTELGRCTATVKVINSGTYQRVVDFGARLIEEGLCKAEEPVVDEPKVH